MHEYELVVVMNPDIAEEDVPAAIERADAARHEPRRRGRRGDAVGAAPAGVLQSARHTKATTSSTQIRLDPARAHELESGFAISEDILRHLLIRKDEE